MKSIEITARTVDEAIKLAAEKLEVELNEIEIEIIEESSKGFLGLLGGKQAKIRARKKLDQVAKAQNYLENILDAMEIRAEVFVNENGEYTQMTFTGDNIGLLIGRRGETLDALQYLVNLVVNKNSKERKRIVLDAEGYRQKREDTLSRLAIRLAEQVKRTGYKVVLEPMNPQERRIIHTALQNDRYVQTLSEGDEPYRKVVISLKQK